MKVIHLVPSMGSAGGGPPLSVSSLAYEQSKMGINVSVLSGLEPPTSRLEGLKEEIGGLPDLTFLRSKPANPAALATAAFRYELEPETIVHIHDPWAPIAMALAHSAHRRKLSIVLSPRGSFGTWALTKKPLLKKALKPAMTGPWGSASLIHYVSEAEARASRAFVNRPDIVIPNGVPRLAIETSRAARTRHVLFLSRLAHNKHPEVALRAFARVAPIHEGLQLVLAGPDQDGIEQELKALATELGVGDRVHTPGSVSGSEKYRLLSEAAAVVHPTEQEALSMTILESLAMGIPLVTTHGANMPELASLDLASVGTLDEHSMASGLMEALAEDGSSRAVRAQEFATAKFQWSAIAQAMTNAYEAL